MHIKGSHSANGCGTGIPDSKTRRLIEKLIGETFQTVNQGIRAQLGVADDGEILRRRCMVAAIDALDRADGAELADEIIDSVISKLRRRFPDHSTQALELLLADIRAETIDILSDFTDGLIDRDEFIKNIVVALDATVIPLRKAVKL